MIEYLESIINLLIDMLSNNLSNDEIALTLRRYHYCFYCRHHFRQCTCNESSSDTDTYIDDNYESSSCSQCEYSSSDSD
jgi:hypothetical protein